MVNTDHTKNKKGGNKLRTYRLIKQQFGKEKYLEFGDTQLIKSIAKL